jgi:hypothetical protein
VRREAPGLPTVSFVDLPGLRLTPDLRVQTERLINKYLSGQNMFLLVVPAVIPSLASDGAFGLVLASNKATSTILVQSRSDEANDIQWHRGVVPRLLGRDPEMAAHGFRGCIATKCRGQNEDGSEFHELAKSDVEEQLWAAKRLASTSVTATDKRTLENAMRVRL